MSTDILSTSNLSPLSTKTSTSTNEFKSQSNIDIEMKNSMKNDQSLSYWQSINNLVISDPSLIQEIIQRYVHQLKADEAIHVQNGDVMNYAAIAAPRLGCHLDKTTRIAHDLAYALFPPKNIQDETLLNWSKIRYSKLISSLSKMTKEKMEQQQQQQQQLVQQHGHKQQYKTCSIPRQLPPISAEIANPAAMPVVQSASDDFIDIFNYLQTQQTQHDGNHIENTNVSDVEASKLVEFKRGVVYTDGRVDLCKQVVGPACIGDLMDALRENTFIKHFLLGNNIIGTTGAKAIAHFITTVLNPNPHRMMRTFYLAGNDINHIGIQYLTDALIHNTCVDALWLKRNPIGIEGSTHIANLLLHNAHISILDLDNCALFDDGIVNIMNALIHAEHDTLRHLYLNSNGIGVRGAQAIASYFEHVRNTGRKGLKSLWMSVNRIGDEGAILIGNAIRNNTTLKRLTLGSNNITAVGAKVLLENLITCPSLQHLSLSMYVSTSDMGELPNHLGDEGAQYVAEFIQQHDKIQSISLAHNGITDIGREALEKAILKKANMLDIELAENKGLLQHQLSLETTSFLLSNIRHFYNNPTMTLQDYHQHYQRHIKQPRRVQYIDSVYRTRAFVNRAERVKMIKRWDEIKWDTEQRQAGLTALQSHKMGFGTYRLLNDDAYNSVLNAIKCGYRLIDTAVLYKNQLQVGRAMSDAVKRGYIKDADKDLFVTTKVLDGDQQKGADAIIHSLTKSLIELKLQKLHLVLLHNYIPGHSHEAWRTLVSLQNRGLIQHIGVSNFSIQQLESLKSIYFDPKQQHVSHLDGYILPLVNQIEISPYCYRSKIDLIRYCQQENIMIQCHTPLIKGKKLDDLILCEIAKEMQVTPAQVLLIWSIHHMKLQVLARSSNPQHIKENLDVININQTLTQKQLNALENIDDGFVTHKVKEKL